MLNGEYIKNRKWIISIFTTWLLICTGFACLNIMPIEVRAAGPTNVSGIITKNTTWTEANSPYIVKGQVLVDENTTLTIKPGVRIEFDWKYQFIVEGTLIAKGTKDKMITFTISQSNTKGEWASLSLSANPRNSSIIEYCKFQNTDTGVRLMNKFPHSLPIFRKNIIEDSGGLDIFYEYYNYYAKNYITDQITNNSFIRCSNGIEFFPQKDNYTTILQNNYTLLIENNYFRANIGINIEEKGINTVVRNNVFFGCDRGIYSDTHSSGTIKNTLIAINNTIAFGRVGFEISHWDDQISMWDEEIILKNNTFAYNEYGLFLAPGNVKEIKNNNIFNNSVFNVYHNSPKKYGDFDLRYNWWGTINETEINETIHDYYNNWNIGKVIYKPYLTKPSQYAPDPKQVLGPVANAGLDQNTTVNQIVYFNGSKSYDPYGDHIYYYWDFGDGNFSNNIYDYFTSHKYSKPGNYTVTLTVTDGFFNDTDTCVIRVINRAPIANVGPNQNVTVNQTVYFNGSNSQDPDGDDLKFKWNFGDGTSTGWLTQSNTTHLYTKAGNYTVTLTVSDGSLIDTDTCMVRVKGLIMINNAPVAEAGANQSVIVNQTVYLNGGGSYDPDNDKLTYKWNFGDGTSTDWLSNNKTTHSYTLPGNYTVTLNVSDGSLTDTDTCIIRVFRVGGLSAPEIKTIPDLNIHWSEEGYGYDFSYFVSDPDNDRSELTIWIGSGKEEEDARFEIDKTNNMRIIFKFPFSSAGKTYPLTLNIMDPSNLYSFKLFKVTVIVDNWPVEQIKPIPDFTFLEDGQLENAFDLWDYFIDIDGGTSFEVLDDLGHHIKAEVDENNYIDLSSDEENWNTGDGTVEMVIVAKDIMPVQNVYAIVEVTVSPINDPPIIDEIPNMTMRVHEEIVLDLNKYIKDIDTPFNNLTINLENVIHYTKEDNLLIITINEKGRHEVTLLVSDEEFTVTKEFIISVTDEDNGQKPQDVFDTDGDGIPDAWEKLYGLDPEDSSDASLDYDSDLLTNLMEYLLGTNPKNNDTDNDNVLDGTDAFPTDPAASVDSDGDNYPDNWNPGKSEKDSTTGLKLDAFPNDPDKYKKEISRDYNFEIILIILVIIILVTIASTKLLLTRSKRQREAKTFPDDDILRIVRHKILHGEPLDELDCSYAEIEEMLEKNMREGKITKETYDFIKNKILCVKEPQLSQNLGTGIEEGKT